MADETADHEVKPEKPMDEALAVAATEEAKHESPENTESVIKTDAVTSKGPEKKPKPWTRSWLWCKTHKRIAIPVAVVVLLLIWFAIPFTRYTVLGLFIKENFTVTVQDSASQKPISGADVAMNGTSAKSDNQGHATLHVSVGSGTVTVTKKYFETKSQSVMVTLSGSKNNTTVALVATGRQVPIVVTNKITGKPVENVTIKAADTTATTDAEGKVVLVLPTGKDTQEATVSAEGYNEHAITVKVTEQADKANEFTVTPAGKIYFVSKATGKLDVVKTDLDGTNRKTVLAGTGKEDDSNTNLIASRDWKYLALYAKRDSDLPKLYLISTSDDKLTTMDEGNAAFTLYGWANDTFVYTVDRNTISEGVAKKYALKSYDATHQKLTTLDESAAEVVNGNTTYYSVYDSVYLFGDQVLYNTRINNINGYHTAPSSLQMAVTTVKSDGTNKKLVKGLPGTTSTGGSIYLTTYLTKPQVIYYETNSYEGGTQEAYYIWDHGTFKDAKEDSEAYAKGNTIYYESPDGKKTFWYEARDGKNTFLVGDADGGNGKSIGSISELVTHGWYTDDYVLLAKNDSELYISSVSGGTPFKISDYHKPGEGYPRYGGGY